VHFAFLGYQGCRALTFALARLSCRRSVSTSRLLYPGSNDYSIAVECNSSIPGNKADQHHTCTCGIVYLHHPVTSVSAASLWSLGFNHLFTHKHRSCIIQAYGPFFLGGWESQLCPKNISTAPEKTATLTYKIALPNCRPTYPPDNY